MESNSRKQPVPAVNGADVERVVRRDFRARDVQAVLSQLDAERDPRWQNGRARIQLAVLKLANGELEKLDDLLRTASIDYRDVLSWAEYPAYIKLSFKAARAEREKAIEEDWRQYQEWLLRE